MVFEGIVEGGQVPEDRWELERFRVRKVSHCCSYHFMLIIIFNHFFGFFFIFV